MSRQTISTHDLLRTFADHYNKHSEDLEVTPPFITDQINKHTLISNMFSSYVIRPKAFDPDPLGLPKKF